MTSYLITWRALGGVQADVVISTRPAQSCPVQPRPSIESPESFTLEELCLLASHLSQLLLPRYLFLVASIYQSGVTGFVKRLDLSATGPDQILARAKRRLVIKSSVHLKALLTALAALR